MSVAKEQKLSEKRKGQTSAVIGFKWCLMVGAKPLATYVLCNMPVGLNCLVTTLHSRQCKLDVTLFCVAMVLFRTGQRRQRCSRQSGTVSCTEGGGAKREDGGREKERRRSLPRGRRLALLQRLTCHNHFLKSASHAPARQLGRRGQVSCFARLGRVEYAPPSLSLPFLSQARWVLRCKV